MSEQAFLAIAGMAAVTYATRAGGIWLISHTTLSPGLEKWLDHIPVAILISIIAPAIVEGSTPVILAALATAVFALRSRSLLLTLLFGFVMINVFRAIL